MSVKCLQCIVENGFLYKKFYTIIIVLKVNNLVMELKSILTAKSYVVRNPLFIKRCFEKKIFFNSSPSYFSIQK